MKSSTSPCWQSSGWRWRPAIRGWRKAAAEARAVRGKVEAVWFRAEATMALLAER